MHLLGSIMLARLNSTSEVSLLPTGLGNHYTSNSKHLIPPGRRRFPYNHSVSSYIGDPNAPAANMSFREQQEYFGPDVLVILGLVLACLGAILTLISFYCQFKHPAIQATMAGIGPSLVGIGMLFCILRLFFCTFFISRTCCECIADGLRFVIVRCPCCKRKKKKVHPLKVKDNVIKPTMNGVAKSHKQSMEMLPRRMEPIHESEEHREQASQEGQENNKHPVSTDALPEEPPKPADELLKDEIDFIDEMRTTSPHSEKSLHKDINELVLKSQTRY